MRIPWLGVKMDRGVLDLYMVSNPWDTVGNFRRIHTDGKHSPMVWVRVTPAR